MIVALEEAWRRLQAMPYRQGTNYVRVVLPQPAFSILCRELCQPAAEGWTPARITSTRCVFGPFDVERAVYTQDFAWMEAVRADEHDPIVAVLVPLPAEAAR